MSGHSAHGGGYRARRARLIRLSPFCVYCEKRVSDDLPVGHPDKATIEHVFPISRGGPVAEINEVVACWKCNSSKGAKVAVGPDPRASRDWFSPGAAS